MKKGLLQDGEQLWMQFLAEDKIAFSRLYKYYISDLYHFGCRICKNQELVKDSLQELFISLWNKRDSLPEVKNVKSYLITSLRNRLIRKMSNSQKTKIYNIDELLLQSNVDQIADDTEKERLSKKLRIKISHLSLRQKEVLHLRYYQNLSLVEISEIMNMKYQSVSNLLGRAINKMKNTWAEDRYLEHNK